MNSVIVDFSWMILILWILLETLSFLTEVQEIQKIQASTENKNRLVSNVIEDQSTSYLISNNLHEILSNQISCKL